MNYELVISICAIVVSVISLVTSIVFSRKAQEHNRKSVWPFPYLNNADYQNNVTVQLHNKGTGPMVVSAVMARLGDAEGQLIDLVPSGPAGYSFSTFAYFNKERAILPGEVVALLDAQFDLSDANQVTFREQLRGVLKDCTIEVEYTDVYRTKFPTYKADCKWFGRTLKDDGWARSET